MRSRLWDEDATIVVSTAVFRAFPFGIWDMGDQVEVSLGHHKAGRAAAVLDAVRTGMIEQRTARLLLPQLTDAEFAGCMPSPFRGWARRMVDATPPPMRRPQGRALASSGVRGRLWAWIQRKAAPPPGSISPAPACPMVSRILPVRERIRKSYPGFCYPHRCSWAAR